MFGAFIEKLLQQVVEQLKTVVKRLERLDDIERQLHEMKKILEEQKNKKQS